MNTPFINRTEELIFLHKKFRSQQPELLIFRGRRRVGKTFLLREFSRQVDGLYFMNLWFHYVFPHWAELETGGREHIMEKIIRPDFDKFVSHVCERIIRQLLHKDFFKINLQFDRLGRHWDSQTEIDIFGYTTNGDTVIGEIKWTASPVGEEVLQALDKKISRMSALIQGEVQKIVIAKSGFAKGLAKKHAEVILIDLGKFKV